jgi:hypothetical protein
VPRTVRPQQSGLEQDLGRLRPIGRRCTRRFAGRLRTGSSRLTITGEQGCLAMPRGEGLPVEGALLEPFVPFPWRVASSRAAGLLLITRSPVRAAFCPGGASRLVRRWGEGGAAAGRLRRPVPLVRVRGDLVELAHVVAEGLGGYSDASQSSVHVLWPRNFMSHPPLLRRRSSRRTRVGRASRVPLSLAGCAARYR